MAFCLILLPNENLNRMNLSKVNSSIDWKDLVKEFKLPLYVYDANKIEEQFESLKAAFPTDKLQIHYACKANSNNQVIKILKSKGAKLDTVSWNETRLGKACGYSPKDIHFTPNGAPFEEYENAIKEGYSLSVDSLPIINEIAEKYPGQELCIRLNPNLMAGGHQKISVGHKLSKFGLSTEHIQSVVDLHQKSKIKVTGLHIHTGSDIADIDAYRHAVKILLENAVLFKDQLKYLDFGGGFKVPYSPGEKSIDIQSIGQWITQKVEDFDHRHGTDLKIYIEPGKYLVSEAGYFLTSVSQVRETHGTKFAYLKAGFNHFIRPMYYDAEHHISQLSNPQGVKELYNIVGYLCETDTFASNRWLPEIRVGDILAFHNAGAYAYIMASNYNLRERPSEILLQDGNVKIIQKREDFQDLIRGQIWDNQ